MKTVRLSFIGRLKRWYLETPDRALDQAYDAALLIRAIELEHFNGEKVAANSQVSENVLGYFQAEVEKALKILRIRLSEFKLSRSTLDLVNPNASVRRLNAANSSPPAQFANGRDKPGMTLEKLKFIDEILARYGPEAEAINVGSTALIPLHNDNTRTHHHRTSNARSGNNQSLNQRTLNSQAANLAADSGNSFGTSAKPRNKPADLETISDKTGLLPRSIISTLNRLRRDLDPQSEGEMVQTFRSNQVRTLAAVRFLLLLVCIPLLIQVGTRSIILSNNLPAGHWIAEKFKIERDGGIFLNAEMTEEALTELKNFKEKLEFENMVREVFEKAPLLPEKMEVEIKQKAVEIANQFADRSADAIKNWIADLLGLAGFTVIVMTGNREIEIVKDFIDEVAYGLSDSAKAFIIILFTDIFVGFHSPHGWEVILEGIAKHFGLPPNHDFMFLFIATFPVILDTIFKYWIFRYLNRVSPSAVATYKEMNE
jgi:CemA family